MRELKPKSGIFDCIGKSKTQVRILMETTVPMKSHVLY